MFDAETSNRLFEIWPQLTTSVLKLLGQNVKDKTVQQLLATADGDVTKGE